MRWNTKRINPEENMKANKLYELSTDSPVATVIEKHTDSEPEIVDVEVCIPPGGRAIIAREYRNKDFSDSKAADILCIVVDAQKKSIVTGIYDIKRTMTGYDEQMPLMKLRKKISGRIFEFIQQIQDSILHKDGLLAEYRYDEYIETVMPGIITREFDGEKLIRLSEKILADIGEPFEQAGAIGQKYDMATCAARKEAGLINDFGSKKIKILNRVFEQQVYILKHSMERNGYYQKITIGGQVT